MNELLSVSVIVATYNREGVLCNTIARLIEQDYHHFEIIVVDQTVAHDPETGMFLRQQVECGAIRYFRLARPSLPEARNYGVLQASGEIILFVDDDVLPDKTLIAAHVAAYTDKTIGGVAGRRTFPSHAGIREDPAVVGDIRRSSEHITNFSSSGPSQDVKWASGCNMSFRKHLFKEVGLFNPLFIGSAVYEDVDFCFRLRKHGYRIVFIPEAHLVHLIAGTGGCEARNPDYKNRYALIHNSFLFAFLHMPPKDWPVVICIRLVMCLSLVKESRDLWYFILYVQACFRLMLTLVILFARRRRLSSYRQELSSSLPVAKIF